MKKMKVVLAVAVAAVMVMAMSLTALAAPAGIAISNEHAKTGDTITVTVSTSDKGMSADVEVQGLDITGVTGGMSTESDVVLYQGNTTATYTCVVTAEEGQDYSFTLTNVEVSLNEGGLQSEDNAAVSGTVEAAVDPQPSTQPSEDPQPSEPTGEPSAQPSDSQNADELDDVPKTGDATTDLWVLAVVGIAAAATVAVVAGKKVFSHK